MQLAAKSHRKGAEDQVKKRRRYRYALMPDVQWGWRSNQVGVGYGTVIYLVTLALCGFPETHHGVDRIHKCLSKQPCTHQCAIHTPPHILSWYFGQTYELGPHSLHFNSLIRLTKLCGIVATR
jgi:hypothetical protein